MRPLSTVMGVDFKSVTNGTNCCPVTVLIVRHQFMRKSDELAFRQRSAPCASLAPVALAPNEHLRSLPQAAASVRCAALLTTVRLDFRRRTIIRLSAIRSAGGAGRL